MDYVYSKNGWQIDSFVPWRGRLWGVCNTPLHRDTKNRSLRVGCFNGESIFWSVRVGAYCIHPKMYRVDDSIDRRELNFWSVSVGEYCIRPSTYRAGDSIDRRELNFWSVSVGAYCICPKTYRVGESMDKRESIFWFVSVVAYYIRPKTYREDESFAHCHGHLWGVCNTPLHRYTKNGSLGVGGFNGESNFWRV